MHAFTARFSRPHPFTRTSVEKFVTRPSLPRRAGRGERRVPVSRFIHRFDVPAVTTTAAQLTQSLALADTLSAQQYAGIQTVRAATAEKMNLRRKIRSAHLEHLASVARLASREAPELVKKFALVSSGAPNLAFSTAARAMLAEGEGQKDLLVKHGLGESALTGLQTLLDEFDAASARSTNARRSHVGASLDLQRVAHELMQIVAVIDSYNRIHLEGDAELMAEWQQTSSVVSTPRAAAQPMAAEVKPAA